MSTKQPCPHLDCNKNTTYDKPLCHAPWLEWEAWELGECNRCHWIYGSDEFVLYDINEYGKEVPLLCDNYLGTALMEKGRETPWHGWRTAERRPVLAHASLERPVCDGHIFKLYDGMVYVGQTTSLDIRLREHIDGLQSQTKGKDSKLVYFRLFVGGREGVKDLEDGLTLLKSIWGW